MRQIRARYLTDIPAEATERQVSAHRRKGPFKWFRTVELCIGGEIVGRRQYDEENRLILEVPRREGRTHGRQYEFHDSGTVSCRERYRNGLQHGVSYQLDEEGHLLGTYVLRDGSGLDVWRGRSSRGRPFASEIRTLRSGILHGFEWWLVSRRCLSSETHWVDGKKHGIERSWRYRGKLEPGFPKFWISDRQVTKREYLVAARLDITLPAFLARENRAQRSLPKSVREILARTEGDIVTKRAVRTRADSARSR